MVSRLGTDTFEWFYPVRVAAVVAVLWCFRDRYRELDWRVGATAVAMGVAVFAIWLGLEPLVDSGAHTAMPAVLARADQSVRNTWLALRIAGAVITVPIAEELAFRGFLMRRLASDDFERVRQLSVMSMAILVSSCAFGFLHGERWLAGTLAGMVYAAAYLRRGSIGDAIAAHATTNALIAAWVLGAGQWQLW
jgi:CAAX prenyl protease-like protein